MNTTIARDVLAGLREAGSNCCPAPRCNHHCPLCPGEHDACEFAAGSLRCVRRDCQNPHHRSQP